MGQSTFPYTRQNVSIAGMTNSRLTEKNLCFVIMVVAGTLRSGSFIVEFAFARKEQKVCYAVDQTNHPVFIPVGDCLCILCVHLRC